MKNYIKIFAFVLVAISIFACKPAPKLVNLDGEWVMEDVILGEKNMEFTDTEVYLSFNQANFSFEIFQKVGGAHFLKFEGSYTVSINTTDSEGKNMSVVSGVYSDGKSWGADYSVSLSEDGNLLYMTPSMEGAETYVYRRFTIPSSVREDAKKYMPSKAVAIEPVL